MDEVVVSGFEVHGQDVVLRHVCVGLGKGAFDDSLHADGVGVYADVLVLDCEHVMESDFEFYARIR